MISFAKRILTLLTLLFAPAFASLAQSAFLEVPATPYDHQMARIEPTLTAPSGYTMEGLSFALINEWMIELRAMPYRYSREWRTPSEVEAARVADCKGKALALYDRMQLNGATNLRFVIGKRRATDSLTHAWLEWETKAGTVLLDPTFNWTAARKAQNGQNYIAFYGYEGAHKFQAANSLLANRTFAPHSPAAPSQGVVTRPTRSTWKARSNACLVDEGPVNSRSFWHRTSL